jgi:ankyrin repeat protein
VERNSEDIAVLLLKNGANSKLTNNKGVTPLELTEQDEHLEMEDIFKKYTLN